MRNQCIVLIVYLSVAGAFGGQPTVAGANHSLIVRDSGDLWARGENSSGEIGDGTTVYRQSPVKVGSGFVSASAGNGHSAAVKLDGSLWTWGYNGFGQLGD